MTSWCCFDYIKGHPYIGNHARCDGKVWVTPSQQGPCECPHHEGNNVS